MAILRLRRGGVIENLTQAEPFYQTTTNTVVFGSDDVGGYITLVHLDNINTGSLHLTGDIVANQIIKSSGTSNQFLKADGSVDSNTYLTDDTIITIDTTPINGNIENAISSDWAYDHAIGETVDLHTKVGTITTGNWNAAPVIGTYLGVLTGYLIAGSVADIVVTDTVNEAFGKVQKTLDSKEDSFTRYDLTKTDDTNVTLTLGGTPAGSLLNAVSLSLGWTGTLSVPRGGTGQTTYTNGQILIGNTTGNTLSKATITQGTGIVITNGTGTIEIAHTDTSTISGVQGTNGIADITIDGFGHITAVTTADYLIDSDLDQVSLQYTTDNGATTDNIISITNSTESTGNAVGALVITGGLGLGGNINVGGNAVIDGNLTVHGTTTTVNSTTVTLNDPILTLGGTTAPTTDDGKDRGIEFRYYDTEARLGFFGYDDSDTRFKYFLAATNTNEVFTGTLGDAQFTNVYAELVGNAATVTTNANLTGPITSVGNTTSITSQTGTGTTFVMETSPTLITPNIGVATGTSFNSITGIASSNPEMNGIVSIGTSTLVAREDHVHASDTSKADTNQTFYIGTTQIAINRASGALTLAGLTLTTPDIGVATATSINKVTITQPANGSTLTIEDGFTLTATGNTSIIGTNTGDQTISFNSTSGELTISGQSAIDLGLGSLDSPTFTAVGITSGSLQYDENLTVTAGTRTIATVDATGDNTSAFFDYTMVFGTNARAGTVIAVWNGSTIEYTDTSTRDIGNTIDVEFTVVMSGNDILLQTNTTSDTWVIRTMIRTL